MSTLIFFILLVALASSAQAQVCDEIAEFVCITGRCRAFFWLVRLYTAKIRDGVQPGLSSSALNGFSKKGLQARTGTFRGSPPSLPPDLFLMKNAPPSLNYFLIYFPRACPPSPAGPRTAAPDSAARWSSASASWRRWPS